jgi:FKBP-type peptidyl-prolyl cis-trans isomerase SlyD
MKIAKNCVVSIDYTLKNNTGEVLDSSEGFDPLAYIHGTGSLIPGLEKELEG